MVLLLQNMPAMFLQGVYCVCPNSVQVRQQILVPSAILHFTCHGIQWKNFVETSLMDSSHPLDGFREK